MEVLISKALVNSNVSHDEFILKNTVLKEYDDMKEEIKNLKTKGIKESSSNSLFII